MNKAAMVVGYAFIGLLAGHIIQIHVIAWRNKRLLSRISPA